MKLIHFLMAVIGLLSACRKPHSEPGPQRPPQMNYTNFNNREVKFNEGFGADLNGDGTRDFFVYTVLVGDPVLQRDYKKFYFGSEQYTDFPISNNQEVPMLSKGNTISVNAFPGHNWYDIASVVMAQKIIGYTETHWEGKWRTASHHYLPLRITAQQKTCYGWVEASFSPHDEKMILHRAAVCKEANTAVKAGD